MELICLLLMITVTSAFYQIPPDAPYNSILNGTSPKVVPKTIEELKKALCSSFDHTGICNDVEEKVILVTQIFDFTGTQGNKTQDGCYHLSTPECLIHGQKQINYYDQCKGLIQTNVTYDAAGTDPLWVGSNKYIVSIGGGLKGKGLKVAYCENVFIYGLSITDINPDVIWGGDAITLDKAKNVWIHGNYISRIGRQMMETGHNACQNITISYNHFDGRTNYSAYCNGLHYWLWLFEGSDDSITLYHNFVHYTSGRGPHLTGLKNTKVLIHMIKNTFQNVQNAGLVEAYSNATILIEGNVFENVSYIVSKNEGQIYYPFTSCDATVCKQYIGRECYLNEVVNSGWLDFVSEVNVLEKLSHYNLINTGEIDKYDKAFGSINISLYKLSWQYIKRKGNTESKMQLI